MTRASALSQRPDDLKFIQQSVKLKTSLSPRPIALSCWVNVCMDPPGFSVWKENVVRNQRTSTNMAPEREASPDLQHYNLAIEKASVGKEEATDLVMVPSGFRLVVGVLERLPCLSD
ncbi:hypothetical protein NQZ68_000195 [Dissostichus eleginoides]|nr:hypothetical protein NQZ68_000195 [Dissostichus eleginoides]